jgi:lipoprotein signal peptidase
MSRVVLGASAMMSDVKRSRNEAERICMMLTLYQAKNEGAAFSALFFGLDI